MAKLLQTNSSSLQETASEGLINLGNITRSYGACGYINYNGVNTINLTQAGYYEINVDLITTNNAESTTDIEILQNNTLVWLIQNTSSATTDVLHLSASVIVRVFPNCCAVNTNIPSAITFKNAGASNININAINVSVKKVA